MNRQILKPLGLVLMLAMAASAVAAPPPASNARQLPRPAAESVNINTADAETIADVLVGIGPAKAEAIIAHRKTHGPFKSLEQLGDVEGISDGTVSRNRGRITLR
jgi:competence protein ComEA